MAFELFCIPSLPQRCLIVTMLGALKVKKKSMNV